MELSAPENTNEAVSLPAAVFRKMAMRWLVPAIVAPTWVHPDIEIVGAGAVWDVRIPITARSGSPATMPDGMLSATGDVGALPVVVDALVTIAGKAMD